MPTDSRKVTTERQVIEVADAYSGVAVQNLGPDILYYGGATVSSLVNNGSVAMGGSATFTTGYTVVSAGRSRLALTTLPPAVESTGGGTIHVSPSGDESGATDQAELADAIATLINDTAGGELKLGAGDWFWNSQQIDVYSTLARLKIVGEGQATKIHSVATGAAGLDKALFYVYGGADVEPFPSTVGFNWCEIADMELVGNVHSCGIAYKGMFQGRVANICGRDFTAPSEYGTPIWLDWAIDVDVVNPVCIGNNYGIRRQGNANTVYSGWFFMSLTADAWDVDAGALGGNRYVGTVFQGGPIGLIADADGTSCDDCWFEEHELAGVRVDANKVILDGPYFATCSTDVLVGFNARDTVIRKPKAWQSIAASVVVVAGSENTVVEDPPDDFTYANVQDGSQGHEFSFSRAKPQINTVAASGATETIPSPHLADVNEITLTANCALEFPAAINGKTLKVNLKQDATGSRTVTWPGNVKWAAGTTPTLTTTAGRVDRFEFTSDGVNWYGRSVLNLNPSLALAPVVSGSLIRWYDASQIQGQDNTKLASWPDLSGSGRHLLAGGEALPVGNERPTFYKTTGAKLVNGLPTVWFDGSETWMIADAPSSVAQPTTIYIVCLPDTLTGDPFVIDGGPREAIFLEGGKWQAFAGSQIGDPSSATADVRVVLSAVFDGASSKLRVAGVEVASGNTGANGFQNLSVGSNAAGLQNFNGAICEIRVYEGAHDSTNLGIVETYLAAKW